MLLKNLTFSYFKRIRGDVIKKIESFYFVPATFVQHSIEKLTINIKNIFLNYIMKGDCALKYAHVIVLEYPGKTMFTQRHSNVLCWLEGSFVTFRLSLFIFFFAPICTHG